jgi:SAM-dependent methyltransferase
MSDTLDQSRQFWDAHAQSDPLWAILSDPARKGRRWDLERFLQSGVDEIFLILHQLRSRGINVQRRPALDFGCGVGRLSQALAAHFARIDGVDLSFAMIELARSLNSHGERLSRQRSAGSPPHRRRHVRLHRLEHRAAAHGAVDRVGLSCRNVSRARANRRTLFSSTGTSPRGERSPGNFGATDFRSTSRSLSSFTLGHRHTSNGRSTPCRTSIAR